MLIGTALEELILDIGFIIAIAFIITKVLYEKYVSVE